MSFLNQRLPQLAALGNWPAPSPIFAQINEHIPEICKLPYDYLFRDDPIAMAECSLLVWEYYDLSFLLANLDVYNYEAESIGQKVNFYPSHIPDVDRSDFLIKDENDLEKIKFNGLSSGRFPYLVSFLEAFHKYSGHYIFPDNCAPWSLACNIFGLENLLIACIENPDFVDKLFNKIVDDLHIPMFRAIHEKFPARTSFQLANAWASPPMISNELFEKIILGYLDRLVKNVGIDGFTTNEIGIWGIAEGSIEQREKFVDLLIQACGLLSALDPDPQRVGMKWITDLAAKKGAPILLGISTGLLENGPIDAILSRCKEYAIAASKSKTPTIIFLSNIAPFTPPEHVHAAIATIRAYAKPGVDPDSVSVKAVERESFEEFIKHKMQNNSDNYSFDWLKKSALKV